MDTRSGSSCSHLLSWGLSLRLSAHFRLRMDSREHCSDLRHEEFTQLGHGRGRALFHCCRHGAFLLCIHPPVRPSKAQKADRPLLEGIDIDPRTSDIVSASCANCHSERTNWPWYSFVAPVSWIVERDVSRARKHMNFSRWSEYSIEQKRLLLGEIAGMVQA